MEALCDAIGGAERFLVPKSRDARDTVQTFTAVTGLEIPESVYKDEYATSGRLTFRLTPSSDMPAQIAAGWGDVAICSTELIEESNLRRRFDTFRIGEPICRYSVLALNEVADDWQAFLETANGRFPAYRRLPSTFPRYLGIIAADRDLPIRPLDVPISGKAEVTMRDNGIGAVADRIVTGNTVRKVGGREIVSLANIFTEIIVKRKDMTILTLNS